MKYSRNALVHKLFIIIFEWKSLICKIPGHTNGADYAYLLFQFGFFFISTELLVNNEWIRIYFVYNFLRSVKTYMRFVTSRNRWWISALNGCRFANCNATYNTQHTNRVHLYVRKMGWSGVEMCISTNTKDAQCNVWPHFLIARETKTPTENYICIYGVALFVMVIRFGVKLLTKQTKSRRWARSEKRIAISSIACY